MLIKNFKISSILKIKKTRYKFSNNELNIGEISKIAYRESLIF